MVDNLNPSSQFHPYQPPDATPQSGSSRGLGGILSNLNNVDFRGGLEKARTAARKNPAAVLGGLAALAIGAGLMRRRAMR
jgi:hypothetical protein